MTGDFGGGALAGTRVVEFTHVIAGPLAGQVLGDLGAEVVKIESPDGGDIGRHLAPFVRSESHYFLCFNRNKRSLAVDLKTDRGHAVALDLCRRADIVIENFGPGVMDGLGLGFGDVARLNPRTIYCSISGFGRTSPLAGKRSLDLVTQAFAGAMSTNGEQGGLPTKLGVPVGDTAGSMYAVIGILAALQQRDRIKAPQHLDIGLVDCLLPHLANHGGYWLATGEQPERMGSAHYFCVPNGVFRVTDGYVVIAVTNEGQWGRLQQALDLSADDPRLSSMAARAENRAFVDGLVEERTSSLTASALVERMDRANVPCGPVHSIAEALRHPHTAARNMRLTLPHPRAGDVDAIALPLQALARTDMRAAPLLGADTVAVLEDIGLDGRTICELITDGIVAADSGVHAPQPTRTNEGFHDR